MHLYNNVGKNNDDNILRDQIKHYMKKIINRYLFLLLRFRKIIPLKKEKYIMMPSLHQEKLNISYHHI